MGRRTLSREFKLEAVRLVRDRGVAVTPCRRDEATIRASRPTLVVEIYPTML
jgi:hypothetical protein